METPVIVLVAHLQAQCAPRGNQVGDGVQHKAGVGAQARDLRVGQHSCHRALLRIALQSTKLFQPSIHGFKEVQRLKHSTAIAGMKGYDNSLVVMYNKFILNASVYY